MCHLRSLILSLQSFISLVLQSQILFPVQNFAPDVYHGETQNWDIGQSPESFLLHP